MHIPHHVLIFNFAEQQITDLEHSYRSERDSYPGLYLATAYDQQHAGRLWTTEECPSKPVLGRVTILARHALELIESSLMSPTIRFVRPAQLFMASGDGYDLVIELKPDLLPNTLCYDLGSSFLPISLRNFRLPLAGSDQLAKIVQQLRVSSFGNTQLDSIFLINILFLLPVGLFRIRCFFLQSSWR